MLCTKICFLRSTLVFKFIIFVEGFGANLECLAGVFDEGVLQRVDFLLLDVVINFKKLVWNSYRGTSILKIRFYVQNLPNSKERLLRIPCSANNFKF